MLRSLVHSLAVLALSMQALAPVHARMTGATAERTEAEQAMPCHDEAPALPEEMPCCPDGDCDCVRLCHSPPAVTQWAPGVTVSLQHVAPPLLRATRAAPAHSPTLLRPPIAA